MERGAMGDFSDGMAEGRGSGGSGRMRGSARSRAGVRRVFPERLSH